MELSSGGVSGKDSSSSDGKPSQNESKEVPAKNSSSQDEITTPSEPARNEANTSNEDNVPSTTPPPQSKYPSYFQQHQQMYHHQIQQNPNSATGPGYYSHSSTNQDKQQQTHPPSPGYVDFDMHARLQNSGLYNRSQFGAGNPPQLPLTANNGTSQNGCDIKGPNFLGTQSGVLNPMDSSQNIDLINMSNSSGQAPPSPQISYLNNAGHMQPPAYGASVYQGGYTDMNSNHVTLSPQPNWTNRNIQHHMYSPPYSGMGGVYATAAGSLNPGRDIQQRASSFDESTMLPPSTISSSEPSDQFSQYAHNAAGNGGTIFAHHPPQWAGPPHHAPGVDIYSPVIAGPVPSTGSISPVSPRHPSSNKRGGRGFHPGPHMPYFHPRQHATVTPGPPIQTTNSNKGPDGANLFIFHIPNNFTNLDMYQLFCPFGNLLSVRIMVEKDTGRSRGFGFVSYSSPESAALAIKELNGYVIGNKRLKVQHKQIKPSDHSKAEDNSSGWFDESISDNRVDSKDSKVTGTEVKSSPQDVTSNENDAESRSALNCLDSIREALPESSSG